MLQSFYWINIITRGSIITSFLWIFLNNDMICCYQAKHLVDKYFFLFEYTAHKKCWCLFSKLCSSSFLPFCLCLSVYDLQLSVRLFVSCQSIPLPRDQMLTTTTTILVVSIDLFSVFFIPFSYNGVYYQWSNRAPPPPPTFRSFECSNSHMQQWISRNNWQIN